VKSVLITACGPTLEPELVEQVKGTLPLIAVSDTIRLFPWADEMLAIDRGWWERRSANANVEASSARRWAGVKACQYYGDRFRLNRFVKSPMPTSGHGALMLAYSLGYRRMLLAGFTMGGNNGSDHFFKDTKFGNSFPHWVKRMRLLHEVYTRKGVEIVNCTPYSALDFIPFVPIKEAVSGYRT